MSKDYIFFSSLRDACLTTISIWMIVLINAHQHTITLFAICRESGQGTSEDLKSRNFRRELEEKEHQARQKRDREKARSFTGMFLIYLLLRMRERV